MKYIQFIGTQRSGSNLLRVMLNQLPELSAPHPPHVLKTFFPLLGCYGNLDRLANLRQLAEDVCLWVNLNPVSWKPFVAEPDVVLRGMRFPGLLGIFTAIAEGKAKADGASFWCCKSMESIWCVDEIEKENLRPIYIHLYRDGRDVALSFMKAIVGPKHIYFLAKKWEAEQRLSLELRQKIDFKRFISIRYEDLIMNPEAELQSLCDKIGVSYRPSMLDYFSSDESLNTASAGQMWANLSKPVLSQNKEKFINGLSMNQLEIFEKVASNMLLQLGYPLINNFTDAYNFSNEELKRFELENQDLIKNALLHSDPLDLIRRRPQELLHAEILKRNLI